MRAFRGSCRSPFAALFPVLLALWTGGGAAAPDPDPVTIVLHNARIYTASAERPFADAMAIGGDRIVAVGSEADVLAAAGGAPRVIDMQGRRILPGLHDSHIHPGGIIRYDACNLDSQPMDLQALAAFVAGCIDRMAIPPGAWLSVRQWSFAENNRPAGGLANLRQALDAASREHPIVLFGNDGHHFATNSLGLSLATTRSGEKVGLSARSLASHFADIRPFVGIDAAGEPDGAVNEGVHLILGAPNIMTADLPLQVEQVAQIPERLNSLGITAIQEAAFLPELAPLYDALLERGEPSLRIRLAQYLPPERFEDGSGRLDMARLLAEARTLRSKYASSENIRADALKFFVDGVLEGNPLATPPTLPNAAQIDPFHQPLFRIDAETGYPRLSGYVDVEGPACSEWRPAGETATPGETEAFARAHGFHPGQCQVSNGVMYRTRQETLEFVREADRAGFAVHLHAIGDRSVRTAIDAIARVTPRDPAVNRHSIAHLQLVAEEDVARLAALKIPLAFTYAWAVRNPEYDLTVIPFIEKLPDVDDLYPAASYYYRQFYPANSIREAGGILAAGSDAPVDSDDPRPFINILAAVTRDAGYGAFNPGERLGILDAVDAYTINGARLMGQAALTGSLEPGKKADFVVLDRDIIELANEGRARLIGETRVLETWFDGEVVYREGDAGEAAQALRRPAAAPR